MWKLVLAGLLVPGAVLSHGQVPPSALQRGVPPELNVLGWMTGRWTVAVEESRGAGKPSARYETIAVIRPIMNGTAFEEHLELEGALFSVSRRVGVLAIRTYDRFRNIYRVAYHDDASALLDVYEGTFENGRLTVSNVRPDTYYLTPKGVKAYTRITVQNITITSFEMEVAGSSDGGVTWTTGIRAMYTRASE